MKIEQDLRIVIKAAANASKNQDRSRTDRELIEEWIKKNPAKASQARALVKKMDMADAAEQKARNDLKEKFGLNKSAWRSNGEFSLADDSAFVKAGGKLPTKRPKFSEDQVISEYAGAKTKAEATAVLKKYGIIWQ